MDTAYARRQMVRQQVRTWDVFDDDILTILDDLPRDRFVPHRYRDLAYADTEIPLPNGQMMMAPILEGRLLQSLSVEPTDRVLEVGTGSGFLAACLARLSRSVVSIDIFGDLLASAQRGLDRVGIDNVELQSMDATVQLPDEQFDVIALTGSIPRVDARYAEALKPGGRLFVIVGEAPLMQAMRFSRAANGELADEVLFETAVAPLVNAQVDSRFSF